MREDSELGLARLWGFVWLQIKDFFLELYGNKLTKLKEVLSVPLILFSILSSDVFSHFTLSVTGEYKF